MAMNINYHSRSRKNKMCTGRTVTYKQLVVQAWGAASYFPISCYFLVDANRVCGLMNEKKVNPLYSVIYKPQDFGFIEKYN